VAARPRRQRRLALGVLLGAAGLAVGAFPFRATWWGGWILAVAEAGIVGGLADWFAVTAIFRRPLGLPIPHTALIAANWEAMAARVGTMVGDRVLTKEYVTQEVERLDLAALIARGAERVSRDDLEAITRGVARWLAAELPADTLGELVSRLRAFLAAYPIAPVAASALEAAREHAWDQRLISSLAAAVRNALERPEVRAALADLVDEVLGRYRRRMGTYPGLLLGLAAAFGLIDRDRLVAALHAAITRLADDPDDPLRRQLADVLATLPVRLRTDAALAARVEATKREIVESDVVGRLLEDAADEIRRALLADVERPRSETLAWIGDRLERARQALVADGALRAELDAKIKTRVVDLVDRYQGRIAGFIEKGVHALGPEGAVRLIEEHAGDDLQYIRVNGTVVGGLAGGAIYAVHLLLRAL
jgi:uncharacterized membrane-anchored protein YjiN (DUF445 family)